MSNEAKLRLKSWWKVGIDKAELTEDDRRTIDQKLGVVIHGYHRDDEPVIGRRIINSDKGLVDSLLLRRDAASRGFYFELRGTLGRISDSDATQLLDQVVSVATEIEKGRVVARDSRSGVAIMRAGQALRAAGTSQVVWLCASASAVAFAVWAVPWSDLNHRNNQASSSPHSSEPTAAMSSAQAAKPEDPIAIRLKAIEGTQLGETSFGITDATPLLLGIGWDSSDSGLPATAGECRFSWHIAASASPTAASPVELAPPKSSDQCTVNPGDREPDTTQVVREAGTYVLTVRDQITNRTFTQKFDVLELSGTPSSTP